MITSVADPITFTNVIMLPIAKIYWLSGWNFTERRDLKRYISILVILSKDKGGTKIKLIIRDCLEILRD